MFYLPPDKGAVSDDCAHFSPLHWGQERHTALFSEPERVDSTDDLFDAVQKKQGSKAPESPRRCWDTVLLMILFLDGLLLAHPSHSGEVLDAHCGFT